MSEENSSTETPVQTDSTQESAAKQNQELPRDNEIEVSGILEILENKTGQLIDPPETVRQSQTTPSSRVN